MFPGFKGSPLIHPFGRLASQEGIDLSGGRWIERRVVGLGAGKTIMVLSEPPVAGIGGRDPGDAGRGLATVTRHGHRPAGSGALFVTVSAWIK